MWINGSKIQRIGVLRISNLDKKHRTESREGEIRREDFDKKDERKESI